MSCNVTGETGGIVKNLLLEKVRVLVCLMSGDLKSFVPLLWHHLRLRKVVRHPRGAP